jgi:transcription initiation factor TFIIIB Brf1 subunit/transcription initiation factor TFIIB
MRDQERRRQAYLADRELDQLLEATNRRRKARGLPERTREEARQEFGGEPPAGD